MPPSTRRTLFEACLDSLSDFTVEYSAESGAAIEYGIVAESGPPKNNLIIAIQDKDSFHPQSRELEQISIVDRIFHEGDSDEGVAYRVIGVIEDGTLHLNCGEQYFKSFFSSTGELLEDVIVNDPGRVERRREFEEMVRNLEVQRKDFMKEKNKRKKLRREEASTIASDTMESTVDGTAEAVDKKRAKRRAKSQRQKERRKAAMEAEKLEHEEEVALMKEKLARLGVSKGAVVVDPSTKEGQEYIEESSKKGMTITEVYWNML